MASKKDIQRAAALLGRRGGLKKSEQKAKAARETGTAVGGRKPVESFQRSDIEQEGMRGGGVSILGFRSTGEKELRHKGRWYRTRSGRPSYSTGDHPALAGGVGFSSADAFERLIPSENTDEGTVIRMLCLDCGKVQFFFFPGIQLHDRYLELTKRCKECRKSSR